RFFLVEILKEPCVEVGRDDRALRADAPAQPADDRTRASPDVQASPTICNTEAHQVADRQRIALCLGDTSAGQLFLVLGVRRKVSTLAGHPGPRSLTSPIWNAAHHTSGGALRPASRQEAGAWPRRRSLRWASGLHLWR